MPGGNVPLKGLSSMLHSRACSFPVLVVSRSGPGAQLPLVSCCPVFQFVPTQSVHWQNEANAPTLCLAILSSHLTIIKVYELGGAIFILYVRQLRSRDLTRPVLGLALSPVLLPQPPSPPPVDLD